MPADVLHGLGWYEANGIELVAGAGHAVQLERPEAVAAAIAAALSPLSGDEA